MVVSLDLKLNNGNKHQIQLMKFRDFMSMHFYSFASRQVMEFSGVYLTVCAVLELVSVKL